MGKICWESISDLIPTSDFGQITTTNLNQTEAEIVIEWPDDYRVDFIRIDVSDTREVIDITRGYNVVMNEWKGIAVWVLLIG